MESEVLQDHWKAYIDCEPSEPLQVKLMKLNRFLTLVRTYEQNEIQAHSSFLSNASSVLVAEFQDDLLKVSNESEEDDLSKLFEYLSQGRGAILLQILNVIGISQTVDHLRLGNIAMWALKLCLKMNLPPTDHNSALRPTEIYSFFAATVEDLRHFTKKPTCQQTSIQDHMKSLRPSLSAIESSSAVRRCRLLARRRRQLKLVQVCGETDSEGEIDIRIMLPITRQSIIIPDLVEFHCNEIKTDSELSNLTLMDTELHLLTVLKNVVQNDMQRVSETSASMHLIPVVGKTACSIIKSLCCNVEETDPRFQATSDLSLLLVFQCLIRVFFLMLLRVSDQSGGLVALRRCLALSEIARTISENVETLCRSVEGWSLVCDFTAASWLYAHGLLTLHHRNVMVINGSLKAIEPVTHGHGHHLTSIVLGRCVDDSLIGDVNLGGRPDAIKLTKTIVDVAGLLKSMRGLYVHMCTCVRHSHRTCVDTQVKSWHHHDVLGQPFSDSRIAEEISIEKPANEFVHLRSDTCVLSTVFKLLLKAYHETRSTCFQSFLLGEFERGTLMCCCLHPSTLLGLLRGDVEQAAVEADIRWRAVFVLVNIFRTYCGGSLSNPGYCAVCDDNKLKQYDDYIVEGMCSSDSALSGCDSDHSIPVTPRWFFISSVYSIVLSSGDSAFALHVLTQMLHLVKNGSEALRHQLYKSLYLPVLDSLVHLLLPALKSSTDYIDSASADCSIFASDACIAARVCLCALSVLMRDSTSRNHFISTGHIGVVSALTELEYLRRSCFTIVEVLISAEDECKSVTQLGCMQTVVGDTNSTLGIFFQLLFKDLRRNESGNHVDHHNISSVSDCWLTASRMFAACSSFRREFFERSGLEHARLLLTLACQSALTLGTLCANKDLQVTSDQSRSEAQSKLAHDWLSLVYSTMAICLKCSSSSEVKFDSEDVLIDTLTSQLVEVVRLGVSSDSFQGFCETLMMCVHSTDSDRYSEASIKHEEQYFQQDYIQRPTLYRLHSDEQIDFNELGYDADLEYSSNSYPDSPLSMDSNSKTNVESHPSVCRLILKLTAVCQSCDGSNLDRDAVTNVMFWLVSLARKTGHSMHKQGLTEILMTSFRSLMVICDASYSNVQRSILELFLLIARHGASTADLQLLLQLFDEPNAPKDLLLSTLISLSNTLSLQSTYSLRLPMVYTSGSPRLDNNNSVLVDGSYAQSMLSTTIRKSQYITAKQVLLQSDQVPLQMTSSAAACALLTATWKMGSLWPNVSCSAFSLSMWLLIEKDADMKTGSRRFWSRRPSGTSTDHEMSRSSRGVCTADRPKTNGVRRSIWSDSCVHLVSIGCTELLFEIWIDSESSRLVARIMTMESGSLTIQCQSEISGFLTSGRWHHITLSYVEALGSDGTEAVVVTFVDGINQTTSRMDYKFKYSTKTSADNTLYWGHSVDGSRLTTMKSKFCQLGNLLFFNDFEMTRLTSCYLYALGPDCCTLAECDSSDQSIVYVRHMTRALMRASDVVDELFSSSRHPSIDKLRNSVVLMYTPRTPMALCIFKQPPASGTSSSGSALPLSITVSSLPLCVFSDSVERTVNRGTLLSIRQLGGIRVFIYLFAKVVEQQRPELEQAKALRLVFNLIHRDVQLAREFVEADGYEMVAKVFTTTRCVMGFEILKVLTDCCLTHVVMNSVDSAQRFTIDNGNASIISDVKIIVEMLLSWRAWERSANGVWLLAFQALSSLVRIGHPHREHNVEQLRRSGVVSKLLDNCKERLQDSRPSYSLPMCDSMLCLLRSVIGAQLAVHNVVSICDFLLLMNPAASTYVVANNTLFWFRNKWILSSVRTKSSSDSSAPRVDTSSWHQPNIELDDADHRIHRALTANGIVRSESLLVFEPSSAPMIEDAVHELLAVTNKSSLNLSATNRVVETNQTKNTNISAIVQQRDITGSNEEDVSTNLVSPELHSPVLEPAICSHQGSCADKEHETLENYDRCVFSSPSGAVESDGSYSEPSSYKISGDVMESSEAPVTDLMSDPDQQLLISPEIAHLEDRRGVELMKSRLPDQVDALDRSLMKESLSSSVECNDDGLVHLMAGLFNLLGELLHTLSSFDRNRLFSTVLKPNMLVAMANHASIEIRIAIVKFFRCYWRFLSQSEKAEFNKHGRLHLLANQIHQHAVNRKLVQACEELNAGKTSEFSDLVDAESDFSFLLMALVEKTICDAHLCHDTLCILTKIFMSSGKFAMVMLSNGLTEVLCNVIHQLHMSSEEVDCGEHKNVQGTLNDDTLLAEIQHLFCCIAHITISLPGENWYQQFKDAVGLLQSLEARQRNLHGDDSDAVLQVVSIECCFLQTSLQFFSDQVDEFTSRLLSRQSSRVSSSGSEFDNLSKKLAQQDESANSIFSKLLRSRWLAKKDEPDVQSMTTGEMTNRFRKAVVVAVNYALFCFETRPFSEEVSNSESFPTLSSPEEQFSEYLLLFLLKSLVICLKNGSTRLNCTIAGVLWHAKDNLREQFSRLVTHMFSPSSNLRQRLFVLKVLMNEPAISDVFKQTLAIKMMGQKLASYCYELVVENVDRLSAVERAEANELMSAIKDCEISVVNVGSRLFEGDRAAMMMERIGWKLAFAQERNKWLQSHGLTLQRVLHRLDLLLSKASEQAGEMTRVISSDQNALRKKFINERKMQMSGALYIKKAWQQTIQLLTHERAVWYDPKTYPLSWELDLTEGPSRMRRRLQRCYLRMKPEFLLPEHQHKISVGDGNLPLSYLFDYDTCSSESAVLIFKLFANNNIDHTFPCSYITPQTTVAGSLLVGQAEIFFVADTAATESSFMQHQALLGNCDTLVLTLPHEQVQEFHKQWYMLKDDGLEIFLANGKTCLLAFSSTKDRDELFEVLVGLDFPNRQPAENLSTIQRRWLAGQTTNFDYLTQLNKLAGRSINDVMQYPIFPFVLAQYSQPTLDLSSPDVYRILSKTISTQTKAMEEKYVRIYKAAGNDEVFLLQQLSDNRELCRNEGLFDDDDDIMIAPYHYSNHCSNICTVLQFLVRLPPFTQLFINFQDNHFDVPDRTFHSIDKCYQLVTLQSVTDTKELIPEFFYLPEFLENNEGFDFGLMQNEERVDGVKLPPWCHNDARLFTLIHRQALESELVRQSLPGWIDLVFGVKQRGKAAIDAVNVFHPSSYYGIEVESIVDSVKRKAVLTMIRTTGQTPKQLFSVAHPLPVPRTTSSVKRVADKTSPIQNVMGLQWGDFVGSLDWPEPVVTWSSSSPSAPAKLVSLLSGEIFGLNQSSSLLIRETVSVSSNLASTEWLGIISWNHADGIVRVRQSRRRTHPAVNFLHWPASEQVTCCAGVSDCRLLFIGCDSGVISVFNTTYNARKELPLQVFDRRLCLFGHTDAISSLQVCKPFSILVSASRDGTAIIWDLNRLNYVRSLDDHQGCSVVALCVSSVSGDIASASHVARNSSGLTLHTINGRLVARIICSGYIQCLAFSPSPEGQSVNVIAAGFSNAKIRLFSSWTLTPIRELVSDGISSAIVSLIYTVDGQCLYCSTADGYVHVWSNLTLRNKPLKFISYA